MCDRDDGLPPTIGETIGGILLALWVFGMIGGFVFFMGPPLIEEFPRALHKWEVILGIRDGGCCSLGRGSHSLRGRPRRFGYASAD
jgi:hypothetical protein